MELNSICTHRVTLDELRTHLEFDIDGNGEVSDEEAKVSKTSFLLRLLSS